MAVAEFLVGSLDDSGWLATPLEDVAQAHRPAGRGVRERADGDPGARAGRGRRARSARVPADPARGARREGHAAVAADPRAVRQPGEPALPRDRAPAQVHGRGGAGRGRRDRDAEPQARAPGVERGPEVRGARPDRRARRRGVRGAAQRPQLPRLRISSAYESVLREKKKPTARPNEARPANTSRASSTRRAG